MGMPSVHSSFLKKYKKDAVNALKNMNPEWSKDDIDKVVTEEMKLSFTNPEVTIDNNYTQQRDTTSLLTVFDWAEEKKPIIAGNGTFYKNQYEAVNPIAGMLMGILEKRKAAKNAMFALSDPNSAKYKDLDLLQSIYKINANSYYGASGMPASAFYSMWSGGATTCSAQSVISTCYSTFEAFISDNFVFYDINECFNWLLNVIDEIDNDPETVSWLKPHTKEDVFEKLKGMFVKWKDGYEEPLRSFISHLSQNKINRIYYKNRLEEFTEDHIEMINLHKAILDAIKIYPLLPDKIVEKKDPNWEKWETMIPHKFVGVYEDPEDYNKNISKLMFMNPNDAPDSIKDALKTLSNYYMKYVYTRYLVFDRIYRLKNFTRKAVMIIDTDSNILCLDSWMNFVRESITRGCTKPKENMDFIIVNTIAYVLTKVVTDILLFYGKNSNIPEEFRSKFTMKNEFYMKRLIVSEVKKRYMSLFKLREGTLLDPPKTDIKGFDFMKSGTSDICSDAFKKLSEDYLLKSDTIDVKALREELRIMEKDIMEDIECRNLTYLPIASVKELNAYKDPGSEQSVRGMLAWNYLNPDDQIDLPSKVRMLKLTLFSEESIEPLRRSYPDIYSTIKDKIFNDDSGIFVTRKMKNGKVSVNSKGFQVLAIPESASIPEWCIPYIDYGCMIGSIMAPFKSVTELLKMSCVSTGYTKNGVNRSTEAFTNIISF